MSSQNKSTEWGEGLRLVSYCPVCETRYNPMHARVLGKDGETHLLHVQCKKCRNSILALVLVNQVGASSVGLLTDLTYEDVVRFKVNNQVSIDDVIEIHEFLKQDDWSGFLPKDTQPVKKKVVKRAKKNI
jgi:hypothetical protein